MKQLNIVFEDDEYKKLIEKKGKQTWREFILRLLKVKEMEEKDG
jgi:predicted CopG family antitoxin